MKRLILCGLLGILACGAYLIGAAAPSPRDMRGSADKAFAAGNFKDAFINYEKLATDPNDEPGKVSHDLTQGILSLQRLGRSDEVDDFREKTIAAHGKNWRLLQTAAESLLAGETHGFIVAGKFYRGNHRGNDGKQVFTVERDRVRSLQLMQQGIDAVADEPNKDERGSFYFALADILMNTRFGGGAWQLQTLTDLSKLPDYEDGYPAYMYGNGNTRGAPVNADGTPVYHKLPKSWKEAATDGERWRWCLMQASEMSPEYASRATYTFAEFLRGQFDVQSMAQFGYSFGRHAGGGAESDDDTKKDESGPFAVSTLSEDETIARLASGIKRYKLPFEFNFIRLFQTLADTGKGQYQELALNMLGQ
ncbi:MAG: alpha-2-macroglobulin domain protein, partial [Phycisphaerales bacterium]|nr:alpha-2-macroglobulin domain protein [Phycisphaerales bacterium]